jgi:hypothetical protein
MPGVLDNSWAVEYERDVGRRGIRGSRPAAGPKGGEESVGHDPPSVPKGHTATVRAMRLGSRNLSARARIPVQSCS